MRLQVVDLELKARYWEAQWKIRFYTLEAESLQENYNAFLERERAKQEEALKRFQEQIDKMNQAAQQTEESKTLAQNEEFLNTIAEKKAANPLSAV
jgi:hypothetical protein